MTPMGLRNKHYSCQTTAGYFALWLIVASIFPSWLVAQGAEQFYSGKTVQMIVSSGPGVATDIAARLVARYLGKHVPGNPVIITRNMPGGSRWSSNCTTCARATASRAPTATM